MPQPELEQYWSVEETAVRLRVKEDTVRKWLKRKALAFKKAGTRTLITETEIQAFIQRSTEKQDAA